MSNKPFNPTISIPRAEYLGNWQDFAADNAAFIPDHELTRIEMSLKHTGHAAHVAHTAGQFDISVVEPAK